MKILLLSTYEMGRQPFGLASPAAWLRRAGHLVDCIDLSLDRLPEEPVGAADMIAFYVPMHMATKMAARAAETVVRLNPHAHLCFYGLYAPVNEAYLRKLGGHTILGGEFEPGLLKLVENFQQAQPLISLDRIKFLSPDRRGLPELSRYPGLRTGNGRDRVVGYTEASRGCKHLCRHCPIVPVYNGAFRVVQQDVVLQDIRQQVAAGAEHITFGDPDFFNGPRHALPVVTALHLEHPQLTYDVTIKVEHLLQHSSLLTTLRDTGCLFVTTAAESVDDRILEILDKGHTRADFLRVVEMFHEIGLTLNPTFVTFSPWTTLAGYCDLLHLLAHLDLVNAVAPIQLAIRLLIPAGSRLLELEEVKRLVEPFDEAALCYPWQHADSRVDDLWRRVTAIVKDAHRGGLDRRATFAQIWEAAYDAAEIPDRPVPQAGALSRAEVPYLNEPWYC